MILKAAKPFQFYTWFAWRPVKMFDGSWVWWEKIGKMEDRGRVYYFAHEALMNTYDAIKEREAQIAKARGERETKAVVH